MVPVFSICMSGIERKCDGCGEKIAPDVWHFFVRIPLGERSYSVILGEGCMTEWKIRTEIALEEFEKRMQKDKENE